jgi:DNA-binding NtrC family response regulator
METQGLNLFIVDDNRSMVLGLKHYLSSRFGGKLRISTFYDGESCLNNINEQTDVVILDYFLGDKNGNEILRSIKERNPRTEVIMLSSNENIETAVESFRLGAKNFVLKNNNAWRKLSILLETIIIDPFKYIWEFGVTKFVTIFLITFASMGAVVLLFLKLTS